MMVYTCAVCDKQFLHWRNLQLHRRVHSQHRPFHCNHGQCVKSFSQLTSLQSHRRCHSDRRPYQCRQCQTKFLLPRHWKLHRCRTHRTRLHSCRFCALKFVRILSLSYHIQKHHNLRSSRRSQLYSRSGHEKRGKDKKAVDSKKVLLKITAGKSMTILAPTKLISHESRRKHLKKSKRKRKRESRSPTPNGIILSIKRGSVKLPEKKNKSKIEKEKEPDLNGAKTSIKVKDLKLRIKTYPEISVSPHHEDNLVPLQDAENSPEGIPLEQVENSENSFCEKQVDTTKLMNGIKIVKDKSGKLSAETLKSVKQRRKERENVFESFRDVGIWKVMPSPRPDRLGSDILKLKLSPQKPVKSDLSVDTECNSGRFLQIPDKPKGDLSGEDSDILELPMPTYDKESDHALNNVNDSGIEVLSSSSCNRSNGNSVRSVAMDENSPSYNFANEDSLLSLDSPYGDGHHKNEHSICPKCGGVVLESNNTRSPSKCRCILSNPNSPFQTPISPVKLSDISKPPDSLDLEQNQNSPSLRNKKSSENQSALKEMIKSPCPGDESSARKSPEQSNAVSDSESSDIMIISVGDKLPTSFSPEKSFKGKLKLKIGNKKSAGLSVDKTLEAESNSKLPNSEDTCEKEQSKVNKQKPKRTCIKASASSPNIVPIEKTHETLSGDMVSENDKVVRSVNQDSDLKKAATPNKTILSTRYGTVHSPVVIDDDPEIIQNTNEGSKKVNTPNKLSRKKPLFKSKSKCEKENESDKSTNMDATEAKIEEKLSETQTEKDPLLSASVQSTKRPLFKKSVSVEDSSDITKKKPLFKRRKQNAEDSLSQPVENVQISDKLPRSENMDVKNVAKRPTEAKNVDFDEFVKGREAKVEVELTNKSQVKLASENTGVAKSTSKTQAKPQEISSLARKASNGIAKAETESSGVTNAKRESRKDLEQNSSEQSSEKSTNKTADTNTVGNGKNKLSGRSRKKPKGKSCQNVLEMKPTMFTTDEGSLAELGSVEKVDSKDEMEVKDKKDTEVDDKNDHNEISNKKLIKVNIDKAKSSENKTSDSNIKSPLDLFQQQFLSFLSGTKVPPKVTAPSDRPEVSGKNKEDSVEMPMGMKSNTPKLASSDSFSWLKIFGDTNSTDNKTASKKEEEEEAADVMKDLSYDLASINKKMDVSDDDTNSLDMDDVFGDTLTALQPKPVDSKKPVGINNFKVTSIKSDSKHGGPYKRKQTAKRTGAKVRTIKKKVELDFTYENDSSDSGEDNHSFLDSDPDFNPTYSDDDFVTKTVNTKRRLSRACSQTKKRRIAEESSDSNNDFSDSGNISDAESRSSRSHRTKHDRKSNCSCSLGEPGNVSQAHSKKCSHSESEKSCRLPRNSKQFIRNTLRLLQLQEKIHSLFLTLFPDCVEMIADCRKGTDDFDALIEDVLSGLGGETSKPDFTKVTDSKVVMKTDIEGCPINNIGLPFASPESVSRASEIDFAAVDDKLCENRGIKSESSPPFREQHFFGATTAIAASSSTSLKFENNTLADSSSEGEPSPYKDPLNFKTCAADTPVKSDVLTQESSNINSSECSAPVSTFSSKAAAGLSTTTDTVNQSQSSAFSSYTSNSSSAGSNENHVETLSSPHRADSKCVTNDASVIASSLDPLSLQSSSGEHMPYNPSELFTQVQPAMPLVQITIDLNAAKVSLCKTPKDCLQRLHNQIIKLSQLLLPDLDFKSYFYRNIDNLEFLLDLLIEANEGREVTFDETEHMSDHDTQSFSAQILEDPLVLGDNEAITYNFIPIVTGESARLMEGEQLLIPCNDLFKEQIKSQRESLKRDLFAIEEDHPANGRPNDPPTDMFHSTITSLHKIAQQRQSPRKRARDGRPRKRSADEKRTLFVQEKLNNTHNSTFVCAYSKHEDINKETSLNKQKHPENSKEHFLSNFNLGDKLVNDELSESEQNAVNEKLLKLSEIVEGSSAPDATKDSAFQEDDLFKRSAADKNIFELMLPS